MTGGLKRKEICCLCGELIRSSCRINHITYLHKMDIKEYEYLFWKRVAMQVFTSRIKNNTENGCWEFTGAPMKTGYGYVSLFGRVWRLHVLSYSLLVGNVPEGMCVCHKCDNPLCANPDHLFLGTHMDNMHDMYEKGRRKAAVGENASHAKLKEEQVIDIIHRRKKGESLRSLAREFGVSHASINSIDKGKSWKHLKEM